jgi:hypothetical protein
MPRTIVMWTRNSQIPLNSVLVGQPVSTSRASPQRRSGHALAVIILKAVLDTTLSDGTSEMQGARSCALGSRVAHVSYLPGLQNLSAPDLPCRRHGRQSSVRHPARFAAAPFASSVVPERPLRAAGAHDQAHGDARDHALRVRAPVLTPAGFALSNPHFSNLLKQLFFSGGV